MTRLIESSWHVCAKGMRFAFGVFLLSLIAVPVCMSAGRWESCGVIEGGITNGIAVDPQNTNILYSATTEGVFKSINGGENWNFLDNVLAGEPVRFLAINPQNPQILYALAGGATKDAREGYDPVRKGAVFKSIDGGISWSSITDALPVNNIRSLAINPENPDTLYFGDMWKGVYKSEDGGASWIESNSGLASLSLSLIQVDSLNPEILYANIGAKQIYKSTNGGNSWSLITEGISTSGLSGVVIDPSNSEILYLTVHSDQGLPIVFYKSIDGGLNWADISNGLQLSRIFAIKVDPANSSNIAVWAPLHTYRTIDGGANWVAEDNGIAFSGWISGKRNEFVSLFFDPEHSEILYARSAGNGVYKSIDGGANWIASNNGLTALRIRTLVVDPRDDATVYAGTSSGIYKSMDACMSWTAMDDGIQFAQSFYALAIDPLNPEVLYAGAAENGYANQIFKSSDSGQSWEDAFTGYYGFGVFSLAVNPQNSQRIYAGGAGNQCFFQSINGGDFWYPLGSGSVNNLGITSLSIDPQNPDIIFAGTANSGLYKAVLINSNLWQWIRLQSSPSETRAVAIDPQSTDTIYVATSGAGVFKSINGLDFSAANNGLSNMNASAIAIHPRNTSLVYVGTEGDGVFATSNRGAAWEAMNDGLPDANILSMALSPALLTRLYASTADRQAWFYALPQLSQVSVAANPAGRSLTVDGATYSSTQTFTWEQGSSHTISVSSPQGGSSGTRYVFANWSDGGAMSHTITVPAASTTYTANFETQYQLTTTVAPVGGGSIIASPASGDGYYDAGSSVQLTAIADARYSFSAWGGSLTGTENPKTFNISATGSVSATFLSAGRTRPSRLPTPYASRARIKRVLNSPRE